MYATKFVVILFIGVVCANVGARKLEEVPKERKLGISNPKAATTNDVEAQLSVEIGDNAYGSGASSSEADNGRRGSRSASSAGGSGSGNGYIIAEGRNADAYLSTYGNGEGTTNAEAGYGGASSSGTGSGYGGSYGSGQTTTP